MNLALAKKTFTVIHTFINSKNDYFDIKGQVKTMQSNVEWAKKNNQKIPTKYNNEKFLTNFVKRMVLKRSFDSNAKTLYKAILKQDNNFLLERVRYDQKLSKALYELYTSVKLPNSNKEISKIILSS